MQWSAITRKIVEEFQLEGCFLLSWKENQWVGDRPSHAFQGYLESLFKQKAAAYFNEIRFFRYQEGDRPGRASKATRYLALIPISLKGVDFDFLGLIYQSQEHLQDLLKTRVLPMYLVFWLHQFSVSAKLRDPDAAGPKALQRALEEKRLYARQLEHKVKSLSDEIAKVKNAEVGLDQKAKQLERLLTDQGEEYRQLAEAYQSLFDELQDVQREFMETCVAFEHAVHDLERENLGLRRDLGAEPTTPVDRSPLWVDREASESQAERDDETARLKEDVAKLRQKVAFYRKRCIDQEQALKKYRSDELLDNG